MRSERFLPLEHGGVFCRNIPQASVRMVTKWDRNKRIPWDFTASQSQEAFCLQRCWQSGSSRGWQPQESLGWGWPSWGPALLPLSLGIRNLSELPPVTSHKIINPRYSFYTFINTFMYKTLFFLILLLCLMPNEVNSAASSWSEQLSVPHCWSLLSFGLFMLAGYCMYFDVGAA